MTTRQHLGLDNPNREHDACGVGFVARLDGRPSHLVVEDALSAMTSLAHRGGLASGRGEGDGAGILLPLPLDFLSRFWTLPPAFGFGQLFLPRDATAGKQAMDIVRESLAAYGLDLADGRDVPVNPDALGTHARAQMPRITQILVIPRAGSPAGDAPATDPVRPGEAEIPAVASPLAEPGEELERRLYLARKHMEKAVRDMAGLEDFYVASLSSRSVVYKAMLTGGKLADFYPDLTNSHFSAPFVVFHERFSTNTMPRWRLAQPFRMLAHNGEINTLQSNLAHMKIREAALASPLFGSTEELKPVIETDGSDSSALDNVLELLTRNGRPLPHSLMMLLPEPFGRAFVMGDNKRAFYDWHAATMEAWDGPSALVFTDGFRRVGAMLDRNALRPGRYSLSRDGLLVFASESGVNLAQGPEQAPGTRRRQLGARSMFMADLVQHRLITDAELKGQVVREHPYRRWQIQSSLNIVDLFPAEHTAETPQVLPGADDDACGEGPRRRVRLYAKRDLEALRHMAVKGQEPVLSTGNDEPLAALDDAPRPLFDYFRQRFAQVTNPPIDPLREELSMSLMSYVGPEGNLLAREPEQLFRLRLPHPFLQREDMRRLRLARHDKLRPAHLDAVWRVPAGSSASGFGAALQTGLDMLFSAAEDALARGATLLILSDARGGEDSLLPIPSLLAVSALHNHLIRAGKRHLCGLISENDDAWEPMHMAQLIACGADAVCPWAALDEAEILGAEGGLSRGEARASYITALCKGLLKAMARLGISTVRSFRGGHFFECIGLAEDFAGRCFAGTPAPLGSSLPGRGIGLDEFAAESAAARALEREGRTPPETHFWNRESVSLLQRAVGFSRGKAAENATADPEAFAAFAALADAESPALTPRACLRLAEAKSPLPLRKVESAESIMARFVGAAMSMGAISAESHICVARACNAVGARSNSGEGGEDEARGANEAGGDSRSRIRQVASGRFGVTLEYLVNADEIQIKIAQGAKPGEGGQLPAAKVTEQVARLRRTMPGVTLVSPPPHHDIYSIEDLAQLIHDLRRVSPSSRISVKLAAESGVGTVAVGVAKAGADGILISGHDGGTGAAPLSAVRHCGSSWELGLAEAHRALVASGLRDKVRLQTDGGLRSGRDIVIAAILGADEFGFGTALLVSCGCIMCRKCHEGRCPAGIATQDESMRRRFTGRPEHAENFLRLAAEDARRHLAALGLRHLAEARDRLDLLKPVPATGKRARLDWTELLAAPLPPVEKSDADKAFEATPLEQAMLDACRDVLDRGLARRVFSADVRNSDRAVGTLLSGDLARRFGMRRLEVEAAQGPFFRALLRGSAGQSLGAFLCPGVEIVVEGDANDYAGKGLCGGRLIVRPADPGAAPSMDPDQAIIGNVALYGATGGEAYFRGRAGERLAVRNSGALCVAEGAGDHACEYMTGGVVVVLGSCGYNFAAGMSGGVAFVYDRDERFQNRCNTDSVDMESVWTEADRTLLRRMVEHHLRHTGSPKAEALLANWEAELPLFVKVMPLEARAALERQHASQRHGGDVTSATEDVL